jgi:endonuclease G
VSTKARPRTTTDAAQYQHAAAERRVHQRDTQRRKQEREIEQPGGLGQADSLERVATRIDRLSRIVADPRRRPLTTPKATKADAGAVIDAAIERLGPRLGSAGVEALAAATPQDKAGIVLERIINTMDFVGVRYLSVGERAARAVARVDVRDEHGVTFAFGTGSMVSPRLLLTNHHVLEDEATAARSQIEFNFEIGLDGQELAPTIFGLDPVSFFLTDVDRDFTLVAVTGGDAALRAFGHNPLINSEGKAIVGDFVTIVQHPEGLRKQVALRENRVVDVVDDVLHYSTDTQPGSSGSPVFNDQWEIVALHHASVATPDHADLGGIVNEGIRISRIMDFALHQPMTAGEQALLAEVQVAAAAPEATGAAPSGNGTTAAAAATTVAAPAAAPGASTFQVRIPLDVTVTVGAPTPIATANGASASATATAPATAGERVDIDPDYADRKGYDPNFLGAGALSVPLPTLPPDLLQRAVRIDGSTAPDAHVLRYHHYSVVLDGERKLAFYTVVNIDGTQSVRAQRDPDRWSYDPRIPKDVQTGEDVYKANDLDRGHLVRRLDPAWGPTPAAAKIANDDTFHFTNCTPQHKKFNEGKALWAGLEDYLLNHADQLDFKATIFTGPVLASDDDIYRGVQLPRQFWKVAVMVRASDRRLSATGYLVSQERLIEGLESDETFDYGAYRTFQVPVASIATLTKLDFGALPAADPLAAQESTGNHIRTIDGPEDLVV